MPDLIHLPEPRLSFGYNQSLEDPRDGRTLLGPNDPAQNYCVKYGVVATKEGSRRLRNWISKLQGPISTIGRERSRPPYPGFEAAFGMPWSVNPALELSFGEEELRKVVMLNNRHKRNFETVRFFTELILRAIRDEEVKPEVWIIVIPNFVRQFCRPESVVLKSDRIEATGRMSMGAARKVVDSPFYLSATAARTLLAQALESYGSKHSGRIPKEVFVHGKVRYSSEEWRGFLDATPSETNLVGVRIREAKRFRLYRVGSKMPVLRGLAWVQNHRSAILMTRGYIPRMETFPGMEVPLPLEVEICRSEADIVQVPNDVMGLTKLNYNSCRHSDGWPVTLKFADAVGEVLITGPAISYAPLAFKHYI